jgi:non-specific serine/threonine protein kinase/serine/threonine-protein kinase
LDETLRMIREEEPTRPSTKLGSEPKTAQVATNRKTSLEKLNSVVRGDLDWIVMKALEKDRTRRYETASALVNDVRRYLNDLPVSATPPSAFYRIHKFAKRRKVSMAFGALATLFMLSTVVGLGVSNRLISSREKETVAALKTADETWKWQLRQINAQTGALNN